MLPEANRQNFYVRFTSDSSEPQLLYSEEYQDFPLSQQHRDEKRTEEAMMSNRRGEDRENEKSSNWGMIKEESPMIALLQSKLCMFVYQLKFTQRGNLMMREFRGLNMTIS